MMFDFNYSNFDINQDEEWFRRQDWQVKDFKELLFKSQREVQKLGWIASFLENHDQPRSIDKLIKDKKYHHYYSKTMIAGMYFFLRGTPFIYQGQEIGMCNFTREVLMILMILEVSISINERLKKDLLKRKLYTF